MEKMSINLFVGIFNPLLVHKNFPDTVNLSVRIAAGCHALALLLSCRYTPVVDTKVAPTPLLTEFIDRDTSLTLLKAALNRVNMEAMLGADNKQYTLFAADNGAWRAKILLTKE